MEASGIASRTAALVLLFIGTIVCGTLPIIIVRKLKQNQTNGKGIAAHLVTSFLMCFGGGVLFATCFIHLLPDVRESFGHLKEEHNEDSITNGTSHDEDGHKHDFPLPEFLVCAGFFAVYFVEEVLHAALGHNHGPKEGPESHGHTHSPAVLACHNRESELTQSDVLVASTSDSTLRRPSSPSRIATTNLTVPSAGYGSTDVSTVKSFAQSPSNGHYNVGHSIGHSHTSENGNSAVSRPAHRDELVLNPSDFVSSPNNLLPISPAHGHSHGLGGSGADVKLSIGGLLIVVALSFHSIFEGLAVGLQQSSNDVWKMFIAVAIHKFVIAFVVGMEVYAEGTRARVLVIYMVIFAIMSPLGILIGMVSQITLAGQMDLAMGYLNALATGTLLYVTFFEVLQREKNSQLSGLVQFFAVMLGFGIMVIINVYV